MSNTLYYPQAYMDRIASANTAFPLLHGPQVLTAGHEIMHSVLAEGLPAWENYQLMQASLEQLDHLGAAAAAGHRKHGVPIVYTGQRPAYVESPLPGQRIHRIGSYNLQVVVRTTRGMIVEASDVSAYSLLVDQTDNLPPLGTTRRLLEGEFPRERAVLGTLWDVASRLHRQRNKAVDVLSSNLQRGVANDHSARYEHTLPIQKLLATMVLQNVLDSTPTMEERLERPLPPSLIPVFVDSVTNNTLRLQFLTEPWR